MLTSYPQGFAFRYQESLSGINLAPKMLQSVSQSDNQMYGLLYNFTLSSSSASGQNFFIAFVNYLSYPVN